MASISKNGTIKNISLGPPLTDPTTSTEIQTVILGVNLEGGTPGSQDVNFMMEETDYEALGSPGYKAPVTITIATA